MFRLRALPWIVGVATTVVACAPAPPSEAPAQPPPAPGYPQPAGVEDPTPAPTGGDALDRDLNTADEAEQALEDAQSELDTLFGNAQVEALGDTRCVRSCKALGSMRRAVERLCDLTEQGSRCESARSRLERSEQRVTDAGCSCA